MPDEYELLPADELARLRKELEILKANPYGDSKEGKTLLQSMQELTLAINGLTRLFTEVEQDIVEDFEKRSGKDEVIHRLGEQNEQIAAGIVALADMLKQQKNDQKVQEDADMRSKLLATKQPSPTMHEQTNFSSQAPHHDPPPSLSSKQPISTSHSFDESIPLASPPPFDVKKPFGKTPENFPLPPQDSPPPKPPQKSKFGLFRK